VTPGLRNCRWHVAAAGFFVCTHTGCDQEEGADTCIVLGCVVSVFHKLEHSGPRLLKVSSKGHVFLFLFCSCLNYKKIDLKLECMHSSACMV
jgi:hypothetical protein